MKKDKIKSEESVKNDHHEPDVHSEKQTNEKVLSRQYYEGIGRRKTSTARVRLHVVNNGSITISSTDVPKGSMFVNDKNIEAYFVGEVSKKKYQEPFRTTNTMNRFSVTAMITGGGLGGQLDAFIHAASRALIKVDTEKYKPILKKRGFLTRDPRARERRKPNRGGKARAGKQSPKR